MTRIPVALLGASGRLGRLIDAEIARRYETQLEVVARLGSRSDFDPLLDAAVVIDVSLPAGTEKLVGWLEASGQGPETIVSGTTGLDDGMLARIAALGERRRVLHATNFSAGVATVASILRQAAPILQSLGYTPVITETHHRHKKDAPSGTAMTLQENLAPFADVQTHSIRAGEVPGTHEIAFYGTHDRITVRHEALDRGVFASGAIDAALWLHALDRPNAFLTGESYFRERFAQAG